MAVSSLAGSSLADANLADANLAGSNLAGSNLADSNLADSNPSPLHRSRSHRSPHLRCGRRLAPWRRRCHRRATECGWGRRSRAGSGRNRTRFPAAKPPPPSFRRTPEPILMLLVLRFCARAITGSKQDQNGFRLPPE
ncbi:pentapeptide repeat-containing protein [Lysobacter enzymogenes]|uniref:pentapeptide repeat-containing protein n=1 Tax=Lysobacter enzymogenes TaxID=69 RepID=UPI003D2F6A2B